VSRLNSVPKTAFNEVRGEIVSRKMEMNRAPMCVG
jgi:hypothetical protein